MRNIWNQMLGREPEPVWMSALGGVLVMFVLPAIATLMFVAMGVE